jgi:3'(2'), 5'-bisphosphate nucleotidase
MTLSDSFLQSILLLVEQTGKAISTIYAQPVEAQNVSQKIDHSPLTKADTEAHAILQQGLSETPWPVLSEEGIIPEYEVRQQWDKYWLVDPLDGTKEFVARTGEFTVNVALIEQGVPILGIIYVPESATLYWGSPTRGAFKQVAGQLAQSIQVSPLDSPLRGVASRRHGRDVSLDTLGPMTWKKIGSSLKFCALAEGQADLYIRSGPTSEWDTAAGQGILEAAGGGVYDFQGNPMQYNQKADLTQGPFVAITHRVLLTKVLSLYR